MITDALPTTRATDEEMRAADPPWGGLRYIHRLAPAHHAMVMTTLPRV